MITPGVAAQCKKDKSEKPKTHLAFELLQKRKPPGGRERQAFFKSNNSITYLMSIPLIHRARRRKTLQINQFIYYNLEQYFQRFWVSEGSCGRRGSEVRAEIANKRPGPSACPSSHKGRSEIPTPYIWIIWPYPYEITGSIQSYAMF